MNEPEEVTVRVDDEIVFRLHEGRSPLVYADIVMRVAYETEFSVTHAGTVWAIGLVNDVQVLELDDSTVVVGTDINFSTVVVAGSGAAGEATA